VRKYTTPAMAARRGVEVEIKLRVGSVAEMRRRLARAGARRLGRRREEDTLYDTRAGTLKRRGELLRLRRRGGRALVTYKGRQAANRRYKMRCEIEFGVSNPDGFRAALEALGFRPWFRYEKYRTSYRLPRLPGLAVELDETQIGTFLELEGAPKAIDRAARLLGYGPADYLVVTYYALFLQARRRLKLPAGAMRFPRQKKSRLTALFP
jgi:adenylate cyclase class 2